MDPIDVIYVPGLWLFGTFVSPLWAVALGAVGIVGRAIYARAYLADADKRGPGATICGIVNMALLIASLIALIVAVI